MLPPFERAYLSAWSAAVVAAAALALARRARVGLATAAYARFLLRPWKLTTFAAATALVTLAAPWSGDPTWDTADSLLISALVFLLAPFGVGALGRARRPDASPSRTFVAVVALLVPCWAYDAYILWRDGAYPATWLANLGLSGAITALAGLFWSLGRKAGERAIFAFAWARWPEAGDRDGRGLVAPAALLALPVAIAIAAFVVTYLLGV